MKKIVYVLTGDIVNFTRLSAETRSSLIGEIENLFEKKLPPHLRKHIFPKSFQTFRGDSWQILLSNPENSLETCVYIRAFIKSLSKKYLFDCRISIGISDIDYINIDKEFNKNIMTSDGDAFRLSGLGLDELSNTNSRIAIHFGSFIDKNYIYLLRSIINLVDFIITKWTFPQSYVVCKTMEKHKISEIAKSWMGSRISQSNVSQHLTKSGWKNIEYSLEVFSFVLSNVLNLNEIP